MSAAAPSPTIAPAGAAAAPVSSAVAAAPAAATVRVTFRNPSARIAGEGKSKLLDVETGLGAWMRGAHEALRAAGVTVDAREPHIEVLRGFGSESRAVTEETVRKRAEALHGSDVPLKLEVMNGKALVVPTGAVEGYGETHATVSYFRDGLSAAKFAEYSALLLGK